MNYFKELERIKEEYTQDTIKLDSEAQTLYNKFYSGNADKDKEVLLQEYKVCLEKRNELDRVIGIYQEMLYNLSSDASRMKLSSLQKILHRKNIWNMEKDLKNQTKFTFVSDEEIIHSEPVQEEIKSEEVVLDETMLFKPDPKFFEKDFVSEETIKDEIVETKDKKKK